jgi:hypothetical protein
MFKHPPKSLAIPAAWRLAMAPDCDAAVWIPPRRFLALARPWRGPVAPFDPKRMADWEEWPFLAVAPDTGRVLGHEGRHRMAAAAAVFDLVEIVLRMEPDPRREGVLEWVWNGNVPGADELLPEEQWPRLELRRELDMFLH